jgi:hypothetical protein
VDIIDFSDAFSFNGNPSDSGKEGQLSQFLGYDPTTGALTDDKGNDWFFVFNDAGIDNPTAATTVYVEVDGDEFAWNTTTESWDIV